MKKGIEPMRPSEALAEHRDEVVAVIARHGAFNPRIFGSVARGEDSLDSDIDILVELPPEASYYQLFKIEDALHDMLGFKVDVHLPGRPGSRFSQDVARDLKPL